MKELLRKHDGKQFRELAINASAQEELREGDRRHAITEVLFFASIGDIKRMHGLCLVHDISVSRRISRFAQASSACTASVWCIPHWGRLHLSDTHIRQAHVCPPRAEGTFRQCRRDAEACSIRRSPTHPAATMISALRCEPSPLACLTILPYALRRAELVLPFRCR